MQKGRDMREQDLDDLFAAARAQAPLNSDPLIARVLADAALHQPRPGAILSRQIAPRPGFWARISWALGGKAVVGGLGTAAALGVVVGFVHPTPLSTLTTTIFAEAPLDEVDVLAGLDEFLIEG